MRKTTTKLLRGMKHPQSRSKRTLSESLYARALEAAVQEVITESVKTAGKMVAHYEKSNTELRQGMQDMVKGHTTACAYYAAKGMLEEKIPPGQVRDFIYRELRIEWTDLKAWQPSMYKSLVNLGAPA